MEFNTTSIQSKCKSASLFVNSYLSQQYRYWIGIGKSTPWLNEDLPPVPSISITTIPNIIGFVYVNTCTSVYPNSTGVIATARQNYVPVTNNDPSVLAGYKANLVYIEAILLPGALESGSSYRTKGLCTNINFITPPSSLTSGTFVPASNVSSYYLDWISLHSPINAPTSSNHVIQIIKEF
jgi:hypothetical protein